MRTTKEIAISTRPAAIDTGRDEDAREVGLRDERRVPTRLSEPSSSAFWKNVHGTSAASAKSA